ncbi:LexA family protein [Streptomyces sp. NPDC004296]|uniref:LexA family protein n=1 Tax=Streptomyces sp. NPDC004296 TaxID=3364697 RepID=UPI0036C47101
MARAGPAGADAQARIVRALRELTDDVGYSIREIAGAVGSSASTVAHHLWALERHGIVTHAPHRSRSYQVLLRWRASRQLDAGRQPRGARNAGERFVEDQLPPQETCARCHRAFHRADHRAFYGRCHREYHPAYQAPAKRSRIRAGQGAGVSGALH